MKHRAVGVGFLGVMTAVLFLAGCEGEDQTQTIRIGYFDNITHAQALYMKNQGTLEAELGKKWEVEWTAFQAGPAENEALFSGDLDIGYIGPGPAVTANVQSEGDFVVISGSAEGGAALVASADSGIEEIADLDEKTVSIPQTGNTQHLLLLDLLSENGLAPVSDGGTVDVVANSSSDVANLFEQGSVDAALLPEPWASMVLEQTEAEVVADYDELMNGGDYAVTLVIVSKDFLHEHPSAVKKFLKAHIAATEVLETDLSAGVSACSAQLKEDTGVSLKDELLVSSMERLTFTTDIAEESVYEYAGILNEQRLLYDMPDGTMFDTTILDKLEKK